MITVSDVITRVRDIIQDKGANYRTTDDEIRRWLSDAMQLVCLAVPRLFHVTVDIACVEGYGQSIAGLPRALALVDVVSLPQGDFDALSAFKPRWKDDDYGVPQQWSPNANPLEFDVYPPAEYLSPLTVIYVRGPEVITPSTTDVTSYDRLLPGLVQYCVAMAESKDDEHVLTERAVQAKAEFLAFLKGV